MNKTSLARPGTARLRPPAPVPSDSDHADAERQAWQLDAVFKALARRVFVDDDPAAEMPLRQLRVIHALFEGNRSMKELSQELGVSQSAITQLADRLEAAGLVNRAAVGEDRRVRNLELTQRAHNLMRVREERRVARMMDILARIPRQKRDAVMSAFAALKDAAEADEC